MLPVNIEIGRYSGIPRNERYCPLCKNNSIEDEIHVMLYCPSYGELRKKLVDHIENVCESFVQMNDNEKIGVMVNHINIVRKTANYISQILKLRESVLRV